MTDLRFYNGKCVLVTGHTGFKGSWLSRILTNAGAKVVGYALEPPTDPSLFALASLSSDMQSVIGDVRDFDKLFDTFRKVRPDVVFHLAAQPIVRESYRIPRETFETNVMGTVNVLECVRRVGCVRSVVNVTTDKVYENKEWEWGYRETDRLCGFDPYSGSKSCSELATHSYIRSFFSDGATVVSTARAGNVIGGGDYAADRLVPDCVRAALRCEPIVVRNPLSVRPFQHVLEPLAAYLMIAEAQFADGALADSYNVGPAESDCLTVGEMADLFCKEWGDGQTWRCEKEENAVHEANFLRLDSSRIRTRLGWRPVWDAATAVAKTVEFTKRGLYGKNVRDTMDRQIEEYYHV
ncbi:MAG: CDP-glucose 4,6-dehydratase [Clostridia bacterium]|nr:CDP-glucose 4,6-dehydratase [Clostridia bacterium]